MPKFLNLSDAAEEAALANLAGSLDSASALNHAVNIASDAGLTTDTFVTVEDCDLATANSLLESPLPAGYDVSGDTSIAEGAAGDCDLEFTSSGATQAFVFMGADAT